MEKNNGFTVDEVIEMVRWEYEDAIYYDMKAAYMKDKDRNIYLAEKRATGNVLEQVLSYCKSKEEARDIMQMALKNGKEQFDRWEKSYKLRKGREG